MSTPDGTWQRIRELLSAQPAAVANVLRLPDAGTAEDVETGAVARAARALQGTVTAAVTKEVLGEEEGRQERIVQAVWKDKELRSVAEEAAGEEWEEGSWGTVVQDVGFYGLQTGDALHEWAAKRMGEGAGGGEVVDLEERGLEIVGVVEADLTLLGTAAGAGVVEARKAMRARRSALSALLKLVAVLEGFVGPGGKKKKKDVGRIEALTLAADKSVAAAGKSMEKAEKAVAKGLEKTKKLLAKQADVRKKAENNLKREEKVKAKAKTVKAKEVKVAKSEKIRKKQVSFMSSFLKKADAAAPVVKDFSQSAVVESSKPRAESSTAILIPDGPASQIESDVEVVATTVAVKGAGRARSAPEVRKLGSTVLPSFGLPVLSDPTFAPVSRWLLYLVPFSSPSVVCRAIGLSPLEAPKVSQTSEGSSVVEEVESEEKALKDLLSTARRRRKIAEKNLPALLREHRRTRREPRHDFSPRFSTRRADLRGVAGPDYDNAAHKLLQFDKEYRPPFVGTMRRRSKSVGPRRPLAKDADLEYGYDSADDWDEEDEAGESLSDDEKDKDLEDAELKTLGMFGSDSESSDDDFLDDGEAGENDGEEGCGAGGGRVLGDGGGGSSNLGDDDDDDDEDEMDIDAIDVTGSDGVIDVSSGVSSPSRKRSCPDALDGQMRKRPKHSKSKFRPPLVSICGPRFDQNIPDPILDLYPTLRMFPGACITAYDPDSPEAAAELLDDPVAKKPRRKSELDAAARDDLARIIHENGLRNREGLVELFMEKMKAAGFQLPKKAEVHRALDSLATRVSRSVPWQMKDESILTRLGLSPAATSPGPGPVSQLKVLQGVPRIQNFCSTPTTPANAKAAPGATITPAPLPDGIGTGISTNASELPSANSATLRGVPSIQKFCVTPITPSNAKTKSESVSVPAVPICSVPIPLDFPDPAPAAPIASAVTVSSVIAPESSATDASAVPAVNATESSHLS